MIYVTIIILEYSEYDCIVTFTMEVYTFIYYTWISIPFPIFGKILTLSLNMCKYVHYFSWWCLINLVSFILNFSFSFLLYWILFSHSFLWLKLSITFSISFIVFSWAPDFLFGSFLRFLSLLNFSCCSSIFFLLSLSCPSTISYSS